tara:strand:+ start:1367 stop:1702 length:336 start_codon:yes stop_codon:yes gene_type:complete
MVKKILIYSLLIVLMINSKFSFADPNVDQWLDTEKTYKDLVNEGYEIKSYSISDIQLNNGLMLILFVTVLQKNDDLYECQEYQTMDQNLETLDMNLICKQLVQPYQRGIGT